MAICRTRQRPSPARSSQAPPAVRSPASPSTCSRATDTTTVAAHHHHGRRRQLRLRRARRRAPTRCVSATAPTTGPSGTTSPTPPRAPRMSHRARLRTRPRYQRVPPGRHHVDLGNRARTRQQTALALPALPSTCSPRPTPPIAVATATTSADGSYRFTRDSGRFVPGPGHRSEPVLLDRAVVLLRRQRRSSLRIDRLRPARTRQAWRSGSLRPRPGLPRHRPPSPEPPQSDLR